MHATLPLLVDTDFPVITRTKLATLQVNLGYRCNQSCLHCHVNAGPNRKEQMDRATADDVIDCISHGDIQTLDLTGGAPELNPHFRYLVESARQLGVHVIDRCNLTILNEAGFEDIAPFLAANNVEIVASLPCYLEENVESQRGKGVYQSSLEALQNLNALGYGVEDSALILNLMYNPTGAVLPPSQALLEADYRRELYQRAGIVFNQLHVLTNMPIQRFGSTLISKGGFNDYMALLKSSHRDANLESVMCRSLVSVDWQGHLYDCDFNQMLNIPMGGDNGTSKHPPRHLRDLDISQMTNSPVMVADHCYGCTAGQGSSCAGALL
ncbi:MAG: arsenosugar biosynthesis radical SAM protein ArsS [Gammaproteobacteria bacterium]|nr:MAG: arsenosugar biosynthesis radical SAM protein ArsS [Gammaproteobacteria bacterium]